MTKLGRANIDLKFCFVIFEEKLAWNLWSKFYGLLQLYPLFILITRKIRDLGWNMKTSKFFKDGG